MNKPGIQTSIHGTAKRGRIRQYKNDAARVRAYRKRQKANQSTAEIRCIVSVETREMLRRMAGRLGMSEREMLEGIIKAAHERVLVMTTVEIAHPLVFHLPMCIIHTMDSREVIKRLKADGWKIVHVKGSHHQFKHPDKSGRVTVPHPKHDLPTGTVKSIFRQAGWKWR